VTAARLRESVLIHYDIPALSVSKFSFLKDAAIAELAVETGGGYDQNTFP
jgi:hypothetical protein